MARKSDESQQERTFFEFAHISIIPHRPHASYGRFFEKFDLKCNECWLREHWFDPSDDGMDEDSKIY
jgi:hypothetical protein